MRSTIIAILALQACTISATTLFVSTVSPNPAAPYSSWATAARSVQDAVNVAPSGALVLVDNGFYTGGVVVSQPLVLMSVNGAQFTVVDGGGTNRCLSLTNGGLAWGFTFTNGFADTGAGVLGADSNCFLTNCVITGNSAGTGGGSYSGTFYNCLFTGNTARGNGYGGAAFNSTLYNCTVSGNSAGEAGGVFHSTLYNSIAYDNSAPTNANYTSGTFNYCCTAPRPAGGAGNITNAPLFVDEAAGNFRLQAKSPCINAGNNAYNAANGLTDLGGNPRIFDGVVDMGAYEMTVSNQPPVLITQPSDQTAYSGNDVSFSVRAAGSYPLAWQWWFNASPIGGATNETLDLSGLKTSQAGGYSVGISNSFGSVTSQVAVLTVRNAAPTITTQPVSATNYVGRNGSFSAAATGSLPFSWQWMFDGVVIPSATGSSLLLTSITTNQGGGYSAIVSNSFGAVTSQVAVLTVSTDLPPAITRQPLSQTVGVGNTASFIADASGSQPLFWQWFFNGNVVPGATNSILALTAVRLDQAGSYSAIVNNMLGTARTANAILTVGNAATRYVWQNNPSPAAPYTSWSSAATTIQDAIDVAVAGDTIIVTNGVYATGGRIVSGTATTNRAVIDKAVYVRSVNGPMQTVIQGYQSPYFTTGPEAVRCIYLADGAVLSGFTLSGGATAHSDFGAGAYCTSTNATLMNCVLKGNWASFIGSGVFSGTLINCLVSENRDGAWRSTLYNCTITRNAVGMNVGGGAQDCTLCNCIVYGNEGPSGNYSASSSLNYCCTFPMPTSGAGNITNLPLFIDPANDDFRLRACSPCIDTGKSAYPAGETDLAGNARVSGGAVDIGCFEFQQNGPPVIALQPFSQTVFAGTNVGFSIVISSGSLPMASQWSQNLVRVPGGTNFDLLYPSVSTAQAGDYSVIVTNLSGAVTSQVAVLTVLPGPLPFITRQPLSQIVTPGSSVTFAGNAIGYQPLHWQWLFNGQPISWGTNSSLALTALTLAQAGAYSVIVTNASGSVTSSVAMLTVQQTQTRFVWQNSSNPTPPYTSWATAAKAIQDAVAAAHAGDQIMVTNGTYSGGLVVTQSLAIRSVNGPQFTIIDGGGPCFTATTDGTSLSGFTLTNGKSGFRGGGALDSSVGTTLLTNCVLAGNMAYSTGGGAYNCSLYNCTLAGNSLATNGAAAASCSLYNCSLTGNSAEQGGAAVFLCNLYNCIVTSNSYAGADHSTLYNCTVTANSAGISSSALFDCILYYNPGWNYWNCTFNYCCTTPMPTDGVGNITNAPLFIDQLNGDFHLQPESPCINAGNNAFVSSPVDLDSNPRVVSGTLDLGAYEYQGKGSLISYAWLQQYGLPVDGSADIADPDHDGMSNWQEWVCGTNPTNALSALRLLSPISIAPDVVEVNWQSASGVIYFVERSPGLDSPFSLIASNITGVTGITSYVDVHTAGAGPFFYRVGVKGP